MGAPCKLWIGATDSSGYGKRTVNKKTISVHRYKWEKVHGPIPAGMYICHKCDEPLCYEITHLFLGTPSENQLDCYVKDRRDNKKLSNADVIDIREMLSKGTKQKTIAFLYGISQRSVSDINTGRRRWAVV